MSSDDPPRAATIRTSVSVIESDQGPRIAHYERPLDYAKLYQWIVDDASTADDVAVLSHTGGTAGRWHLVRIDDLGDDLTDADATIYVGGKFDRVLPASTLTVNRTLTLGTTNAAAGDKLTIVRRDVEAYTYQIDNGGAGGGTLCTMPVSTAYWATFRFDGTDWSVWSGGALPA